MQQNEMSFFTFVIRHYFGTRGPKGDLAGDMIYDIDQFPDNDYSNLSDWHQIIEDYLYDQGACYECMVVFDECWKNYRNFVYREKWKMKHSG